MGATRVHARPLVPSTCRQIAYLYNGPTASRDEWYFTQLTNLSTHHYNPFISPDGGRVGYHRCRCLGTGPNEHIPVLEHHTSSMPGMLLSFRDDSSRLPGPDLEGYRHAL